MKYILPPVAHLHSQISDLVVSFNDHMALGIMFLSLLSS